MSVIFQKEIFFLKELCGDRCDFRSGPLHLQFVYVVAHYFPIKQSAFFKIIFLISMLTCFKDF